MDKKGVGRTALVAHYGLYEHSILLFGSKNAPAKSDWAMDEIFARLKSQHVSV